TKKGAAEVIGSSYSRNVYTLIHPKSVTPQVAESPMAPALQLGRMDVPPEIDADFNTWYNTIYIPNYEKVPGVIRGRRYRAVTGTPQYLTLYEFENPKVSESDAWMAQRDASPVTARIRPHMRHAPGPPGVYVKPFQLGAARPGARTLAPPGRRRTQRREARASRARTGISAIFSSVRAGQRTPRGRGWRRGQAMI